MNFNVMDLVVVNGQDANGVNYQDEPAIVLFIHVNNVCLVKFINQNIGIVHPTFGANTAEVNPQLLRNSGRNDFLNLLPNLNANSLNNIIDTICTVINNNPNGGSLRRKTHRKSHRKSHKKLSNKKSYIRKSRKRSLLRQVSYRY
jgi:hypothetical protein